MAESPDLIQPAPDGQQPIPEVPAASVGIAILLTWVSAPLERYGKGSDAARLYVQRVLAALPQPDAENFVFSSVLLPAVRRLAGDGDTKKAGRLIEYAEGLSVSGDRMRLNQTVTGKAFLQELREGLATYVSESTACESATLS